MAHRRTVQHSTPREGTFTFRDGSTEVWKLRVSDRARNVSVRLSPTEGIVVVTPPFVPCNPERVLEKHREWLEGHYPRVAPHRAAYLTQLSQPLPTQVAFPTAEMLWKVVYHPTEARGVTGRQRRDPLDEEGLLTLTGDVDDRDQVYEALRRFTFAQAKDVLPALLSRTAREQHVVYAGCRVSNARTRWGSCSAKGMIMLSSNLMFLPPELSYHVMCHELTHIAHMDHAEAFHAALAAMDPQAVANARALRGAGSILPAWAQR